MTNSRLCSDSGEHRRTRSCSKSLIFQAVVFAAVRGRSPDTGLSRRYSRGAPGDAEKLRTGTHRVASRIVGTSPFQKITLSHCQARQVDILDMVGVVGSSPIAPTNAGTRKVFVIRGLPGFSFLCVGALGSFWGTISAHRLGQACTLDTPSFAGIQRAQTSSSILMLWPACAAMCAGLMPTMSATVQ